MYHWPPDTTPLGTSQSLYQSQPAAAPTTAKTATIASAWAGTTSHAERGAVSGRGVEELGAWQGAPSARQTSRAQQLLEVGEQRRARGDPQPVVEPHAPWSPSRVSSRSRTSVTPGWVPSTSLSCSTTGGVHRVDGRLITTGPAGPVRQVGDGDLLAVQLGLVLARARAGP